MSVMLSVVKHLGIGLQASLVAHLNISCLPLTQPRQMQTQPIAGSNGGCITVGVDWASHVALLLELGHLSCQPRAGRL